MTMKKGVSYLSGKPPVQITPASSRFQKLRKGKIFPVWQVQTWTIVLFSGKNGKKKAQSW